MLASATAVTAMTLIIPKRRTGDHRLARPGVGRAGVATAGAGVVARRVVVTEGAAAIEGTVVANGAAVIEGAVVADGAAVIEGAVVPDGAVAGDAFEARASFLATSGVSAKPATLAAPGASALLRVAAFPFGTRISLAASVSAAAGFFSGVNASTGVSVEICPAAARLALISASASSAARDNSCMSSGLRTISMVSSSRLS